MTYKVASGRAFKKKIGSRKSTAQLTGLKKFSTYTVTVSAMTSEGLGERSKAVTVTTLEDGEFEQISKISITFLGFFVIYSKVP